MYPYLFNNRLHEIHRKYLMNGLGHPKAEMVLSPFQDHPGLKKKYMKTKAGQKFEAVKVIVPLPQLIKKSTAAKLEKELPFIADIRKQKHEAVTKEILIYTSNAYTTSENRENILSSYLSNDNYNDYIERLYMRRICFPTYWCTHYISPFTGKFRLSSRSWKMNFGSRCALWAGILVWDFDGIPVASLAVVYCCMYDLCRASCRFIQVQVAVSSSSSESGSSSSSSESESSEIEDEQPTKQKQTSNKQHIITLLFAVFYSFI
jgi:hypothetical protein